MTSLVKLAKSPRVRLLAIGRPKAGKTGMLAHVINSGRYEVGVMDFDNNPDPLVAYVKPEFHQNVSIITLEDKYRNEQKWVKWSGEPTAFTRAWNLFDNWDDGEGHQWGPVKKWGRNRILVVDGASGLNEAAFNRERYYQGVTPVSTKSRDWGIAMNDEDMFFARITDDTLGCHVIVTAHIKDVGPKLETYGKEDSAVLKEAKDLLSKMKAMSVPSRTYAAVLGSGLPLNVARHFPAVIKVEARKDGRRVLITQPTGDDIDLGVPAVGIDRELPQETGLLTIFNAITGGVE